MSEKGETVYTAARNPKFEQLRSDHETFLRTFESEQNVFVVFVLQCFGYYYKRLRCVGFILNRCLRLICRTYTDISLFKDTEYNNSESILLYKHLLSL